MKKFATGPAAAALCLIVLAFSSCRKNIDRITGGSTPNGDTPIAHVNIDTVCRITGFVSQDYFGLYTDSSSYTIYYNAAGDPDSARATNGNFFSFEYDNNRHLKTYSYDVEYNPGLRQFAHHTYEVENGRIVSDSSNYRTEVTTDYTMATISRNYSILSYDSAGRVSQDSTESTFEIEGDGYGRPYTFVTPYVYDTAGNLMLTYKDIHGAETGEPITYDNKKNYLQTNEVWMFISRDYSRNNESGASGYNAAGLPLGFPVTEKRGGAQIMGIRGSLHSGEPSSLTYACGAL